MGASLKHKILAAAIVIFASSAFGAVRFDHLEAQLSVECENCSSSSETSPFKGQSSLLHKINIFSVDGKDPRRAQERDGAGAMFAAIGSIETTNKINIDENGKHESGYGQATAFLISPCLIMTNYHAVFGTDVPTPAPGNPHDYSHYNVKFSVGSNGGMTGFKYNNITARPVAWGKAGTTNGTFGDWAVLQLPKDQCVGSDSSIGWLDLAADSNDQIMQSDLVMAGYPSDWQPSDGNNEGKKLVVQNKCRAHDTHFGSDMLLMDCATRAESSGSPIIKMVAGVPKVVGIARGDLSSTPTILRKYANEYANEMIPISNIKKEMADIYGGDTDYQVAADVKNHTDGSFVRPQQPVQTASRQ